jgi:hypothetical protein
VSKSIDKWAGLEPDADMAPSPWIQQSKLALHRDEGNTQAVIESARDYLPSLLVEVGASPPTPMWIAVRFALSDEGGVVETRRSFHWQSIDMRRKFDELATKWRSETALEAFASRRAMNFAYQCIIGMGPPALPLILESLADEPHDWFWALAAIAGEDVAEGVDSMEDAAAAWLRWGNTEGYLSALTA